MMREIADVTQIEIVVKQDNRAVVKMAYPADKVVIHQRGPKTFIFGCEVADWMPSERESEVVFDALSRNNSVVPYDLDRMQNEIEEWAIRNFGPLNPDNSILGIAEEVGELCHSHLKRKQGIRGTKEEHDEKSQDAIADLIIYILNYASGMGWRVWPILKIVWKRVQQRDWKKDPVTGGEWADIQAKMDPTPESSTPPVGVDPLGPGRAAPPLNPDGTPYRVPYHHQPQSVAQQFQQTEDNVVLHRVQQEIQEGQGRGN